MILEYLDGEGDFCVLGDDEQSFQEMLDCIQVTGSADSICYKLNPKITTAAPSPVEELPSSISFRPNRAPRAGHSREKLGFVEDDTLPHDERILVSLKKATK